MKKKIVVKQTATAAEQQWEINGCYRLIQRNVCWEENNDGDGFYLLADSFDFLDQDETFSFQDGTWYCALRKEDSHLPTKLPIDRLWASKRSFHLFCPGLRSLTSHGKTKKVYAHSMNGWCFILINLWFRLTFWGNIEGESSELFFFF